MGQIIQKGKRLKESYSLVPNHRKDCWFIIDSDDKIVETAYSIHSAKALIKYYKEEKS